MAEMREWRYPDHRTGVDDRSLPPLDHLRHERRSQGHRAPEVGLEYRASLRAIASHPAQPLDARSGVVDEDIDAAELLFGLGGESHSGPRFTEIGRQDDRCNTAGLGDLVGELLQALRAAGDERQPRAFGGKYSCRLPSNSTRGPRQKDPSIGD